LVRRASFSLTVIFTKQLGSGAEWLSSLTVVMSN